MLEEKMVSTKTAAGFTSAMGKTMNFIDPRQLRLIAQAAHSEWPEKDGDRDRRIASLAASFNRGDFLHHAKPMPNPWRVFICKMAMLASRGYEEIEKRILRLGTELRNQYVNNLTVGINKTWGDHLEKTGWDTSKISDGDNGIRFKDLWRAIRLIYQDHQPYLGNCPTLAQIMTLGQSASEFAQRIPAMEMAGFQCSQVEMSLLAKELSMLLQTITKQCETAKISTEDATAVHISCSWKNPAIGAIKGWNVNCGGKYSDLLEMLRNLGIRIIDNLPKESTKYPREYVNMFANDEDDRPRHYSTTVRVMPEDADTTELFTEDRLENISFLDLADILELLLDTAIELKYFRQVDQDQPDDLTWQIIRRLRPVDLPNDLGHHSFIIRCPNAIFRQEDEHSWEKRKLMGHVCVKLEWKQATDPTSSQIVLFRGKPNYANWGIIERVYPPRRS